MDAAGREGVGHNYLVEHSAGSGKSNTIGWLAHRLASLHDLANERVFDSVIVVTDRLVLDQQLQGHDLPVRAQARASCSALTRAHGSSQRPLRMRCQ